MAKVSCLRHVPKETTNLHYVKPLMYLALVCKHSSCTRKAVLWLNQSELNQGELTEYKQGKRLFWTNQEALKVDNSGSYTKLGGILGLIKGFKP